MQKKPDIRIIHHMARAGGTLISKCLACMNKIALLSEIHPDTAHLINPMAQGLHWFGLEPLPQTETDTNIDKPRELFEKTIAHIEQQISARQQYLILRDWSHIDFTGIPFNSNPGYRSILADVLQQQFSIRQACTVRHPIDQWVSLSRLDIMQSTIQDRSHCVKTFMKGYIAFARFATRTGFIRYEDFTREPDKQLQALCRQIELPFDPDYTKHWHQVTNMTGDVSGNRNSGKITPLTPYPVSPELKDEFLACADYPPSLKILGYEHCA